MLLKSGFYILIFLTLINSLFSQPNIAWQRCYGGGKTDYFRSAFLTSDGGIVAPIFALSSDGDLTGFPAGGAGWVIKFNADLDVQWQKFYGIEECGFYPDKVTELENGNLVFCGYGQPDCPDYHGGSDIGLMKTDNLGNSIWKKCYGGPGYENFENFSATEDGGYIITGVSSVAGGDIPLHHGDSFTYDATIIKTDSSGNIMWVKILGGSGDDGPLGSVIEIERGFYTFHIAASSNDFDLSESEIEGRKRWIVTLDSLGNLVNENFVSGDADLYSEPGEQMIFLNNQMIIAEGANPLTNSFPGVEGIGGTFDGGIGIFDTSLNFINLIIKGGTGTDFLYRVTLDDFGNYYLLGASKSMDGDLDGNYNGGFAYDYWLMKTDNNFNLRWSKNFGGSTFCGDLDCSGFNGDMIIKGQTLYAFIKNAVPDVLPDYDVECGHINLLASFNTDAWLVAFDLSTEIQEVLPENQRYQVYPNPTSQSLNINSNSNNLYSIQIRNIFGESVFEKENIIEHEVTISTADLINGVYFLHFLDENKNSQVIQIIIQK